MDFQCCYLIFYLILLSSTSPISIAVDTLTQNQVLQDGQTLVSSGQHFELGFFSPGTSKNRYLGIWYKNLPQTVVWVANRNNPIQNVSATLALGSNGFSLSSNTSAIFWSLNSTKTMTSPILKLLNNGNLVLTDENRVSGSESEEYIWQSFDYITDTLLPEMKLGWNLKKGLHRNMTSWSSGDDPSDGEFTFSLESPETPQLVLTKGTEKQYRWGPWDGVRFSGNSELKPNPVFTPGFTSNSEEIFYTFRVEDNTTLSRFTVSQQGLIQYLVWSENSRAWTTLVTLQGDGCDTYGVCGPYGSCSTYPNCKCLKGFQPKSPADWERFVWSGGCERKWELNCGNGDGFVKFKSLKLPDNSYLAVNRTLSHEECEAECLKNCTCSAYTRLNIHDNGGNCVMWSGDLVDMRDFPNGGEELYIRMARAELSTYKQFL
ncbi:S-locus glycoprotein [Trema orientale]|uniref:S-locus glycoprotein n=1 Tax=Trema orientale TaxID=63057 RepID=A0A2P5AU55_TREOI|nr:S-locus glycoprotein [Trema orientale]